MWREFKDFAMQGNVLDLAVAVVIGAAFGKIVSSLVSDLIMPLVGLLMGGVDFKGLQFQVGEAVITYGNFLQNIVDFLIVAFTIFLVVKALNRVHKKEAAAPSSPGPSHEEVLLGEIRDLLKEGR